MALTTTTLTAAIGASDTTIAIASTAVGYPVVGTQNQTINQPIKIDSEFMFLVGVPVAGQIKVRGRGSEGTFAEPHDIGALVITSAVAGDFGSPAAPRQAGIFPMVDANFTIGQDATITPPSISSTYEIVKGAVANITLNAALSTQKGVMLTFISLTAFAHVLTYATGFAAGTNTVATWAATVGGVLKIEVAENGQMVVISNPGVTLSK